MDWRAIGIAIVVSLMFWVVGVAVTFIVPLEAGGIGLTIYLWFSRVFAVLGDVATGATAGWLAGRRGGAHGASANALASLATLAGSVAIGYARMGEAGYLALPGYWFATAAWLLLGIAIAAIAGAIAVGLRQRRG